MDLVYVGSHEPHVVKASQQTHENDIQSVDVRSRNADYLLKIFAISLVHK